MRIIIERNKRTKRLNDSTFQWLSILCGGSEVVLVMPGQVVDFPAWPIYGIMPAHKTLMSFNFTTAPAHTRSTSPKNFELFNRI